jgi:thioredoxin 1
MWATTVEGILSINVGNWKEEILNSEDLVVVEFWSPFCPYCRIIEPVFQELSKMYSNKLKFAKLNVIESEGNQGLATKYGVMGTPTFKFFCGGRPVQDVVGSLTKDYMEQAIEFAIKKHKECTQKSTPLELPYIS